jgi:hypothetical protein
MMQGYGGRARVEGLWWRSYDGKATTWNPSAIRIPRNIVAIPTEVRE